LSVFAHLYRWTAIPLTGGVILLALLTPPRFGRRTARLLDWTLVASLIAIALQLIPVSAGVRRWLTPAAVAYERTMRFGASGAKPISVDPEATAFALMFAAAIVVLFWSVRAMFRTGGIRSTAYAIAVIGLFISPLAIVHHMRPVPFADEAWGLPAPGLRPYGPFVNRNDFAAWLIMALPLAAGYGFARIESRKRAGRPLDAPTLLDARTVWLVMAVLLMLAGLLASTSRSGLLGAAAGLGFFAWYARRRSTAVKLSTLVAVAAIVAVAATFADVSLLATRVDQSFSEGLDGRIAIWRQTLPIIRDFWPVGSGVGTYQIVMIPYQTMSRLFYISHADNELLQVLAEGGVLLALGVVTSLAAGAVVIGRRLGADATPMFWVRLGAATGILALVVQNMVEMTLRVPANAVLLAILAAIATHESQSRDAPTRRHANRVIQSAATPLTTR
jgi:O-antigen ligase/polysaccharide polymerase Wzy-like membrane protein